MKTQYHIDSFQRSYFVIDTYEQLFKAIDTLDWEEIKDTCLFFPDIEQGIIINSQEKI